MSYVSIVLCVKNGEKYIRDCVDSVLAQTYPHFELIVVLNGSDDSSKTILDSYMDQRIKVFETNISQLSFNLNYAIHQSSGDILMRIDVDDICEKNRLEAQLSYMEEYDVVGSSVRVIDSKSKLTGQVYKYPSTNKEIRKKIFYRSVMAHPSVIIKKNTLLSVGGYMGGRYGQDYDLWLRLMRDKSIRFFNISEPLVRYRVHNRQSKGSVASYAEVSGYLLREAIVSKNILYFVGSVLYLIKSVFKS
ncbi:glycosyltransferase [Saccharospirillum sp. HFRX-1]|uniref:glycosyltransferase n=1 Tax=unclassified Saccharospirillum TaxID=2633430 RepID=UPI00371F7B96